MKDRTYKEAAASAMSRPELVPFMPELLRLYLELSTQDTILQQEGVRQIFVRLYENLEREYRKYGAENGDTIEGCLQWWRDLLEQRKRLQQR